MQTLTYQRVRDEAPENKPPFPIEERIQPELDNFLVPCLDGYLLYNPWFGRVALIDNKAMVAIKRHLGGGSLEGVDRQAIEYLIKDGFFTKAEENSYFARSQSWSPTYVTFSTTQKCTLRCKYCYADGGRLDDLDIPLPIAYAAIDLIINNAARLDRRPVIIFLGEGEATASWDEFTSIIKYFRGRCEQKALVGEVSLSTNGVFPARHIPFISEQCDSITFSIDGLKHSHDANRILPNGQGSFDLVLTNLNLLESSGARVDIRATIATVAIQEMCDFVQFIGENTKVNYIHFEPVFDSSSYTRTAKDVGAPESSAFVTAFRKARLVAAEYDIKLYYSGSDLKLRDSFCGVGDARNFLVTTRGLVTSCNEVLQAWDRRSEFFQYGCWNEKEQHFIFERVEYSICLESTSSLCESALDVLLNSIAQATAMRKMPQFLEIH